MEKEKKSSYHGFTEARKRCNERYLKNNGYIEMKIRVEKGFAEEVKAFAEAHDGSTSAFLNRAIDEAIERDKAKK